MNLKFLAKIFTVTSITILAIFGKSQNANAMESVTPKDLDFIKNHFGIEEYRYACDKFYSDLGRRLMLKKIASDSYHKPDFRQTDVFKYLQNEFQKSNFTFAEKVDIAKTVANVNNLLITRNEKRYSFFLDRWLYIHTKEVISTFENN